MSDSITIRVCDECDIQSFNMFDGTDCIECGKPMKERTYYAAPSPDPLRERLRALIARLMDESKRSNFKGTDQGIGESTAFLTCAAELRALIGE